MNLYYKIFKNIDDVPKSDWDIVSSRFSVMYSHDYWYIIDKSKIRGFYNFNYILIYQGKTPVGTAVAFVIEEDLSVFFKKITDLIRKYYRSFLKPKILLCGSPLNVLSAPFCFYGISYEDALVQLNDALHEISLKEKCLFIGIQEIKLEAKNATYNVLNRFNYFLVETRPTSQINVPWKSVDEYLASMKSYYRSKLNNHLRKCRAENISSKEVCDFSSISNILAEQWTNVHSKPSVMSREKLNKKFYSLISEMLKKSSLVLLFYSDEHLIGHTLLIIDGKILRWLYVGREKAVNDSLYFYILFKVIEYAIEKKCNVIECGPSVYGIKQDMGAEVERIFMGLKIKIPKAKFFAKIFYEKFHSSKLPKAKVVFKNH